MPQYMQRSENQIKDYRDLATLIFRVLLGMVLVLGGIKLLLISPESAAKLFTETGFVRPEISQFFPDALNFALSMGITELIVGVLTISGFKTKYVSIAGAALFFMFITSSPIFGYTRLFLDVSLMGLYIALMFLGSGKYGIDGFFSKKPTDLKNKRDYFYPIIRVSIGFGFIMSVFFPEFNSDGFQFMPDSLNLVLGSLIIIGFANRVVAITATVLLLIVAIMNVPEKTILNTKRAIGMIGGTVFLSILGAGTYSVTNYFKEKYYRFTESDAGSSKVNLIKILAKI